MVQLRQNGRESSLGGDAFASVGDAIAECTGGSDQPEMVLTRLCIDGTEVPEEDWERARGLAFDRVQALEIEARPLRDVARRGLRGAVEYAPRVRAALAEVADQLRRGETDRACELYAAGLDALSVVMFAVTASAPHLGDEGEEGAGALDGLDGTLAPRLDALAESQEREDWIGVADVLEFELLPVLDDWFDRLVALGQRLDAADGPDLEGGGR